MIHDVFICSFNITLIDPGSFVLIVSNLPFDFLKSCGFLLFISQFALMHLGAC